MNSIYFFEKINKMYINFLARLIKQKRKNKDTNSEN